VLVLVVFVGIGRWWISSDLREIRELQAQKILLQETVADLERRGGKAQLTKCGGRLCIEASTHQGEGNERWAAPWKSNAGANLVILRGY